MANRPGFTLPELLVTSVFLLALVIGAAVLLQPHSYARQDRNSERRIDLVHTLYAVQAYYDKHGDLPPGISDKAKGIGSQKDNINLCPALVPEFLDEMTADPLLRSLSDLSACNTGKTDYTTGYTIAKSSDGMSLVLTAPLGESGARIQVTGPIADK